MDVIRLKKLLFLVLLSMTLCTATQAQRAVPELTGPVVDQAGILSETTERQVAAMILAHEDSPTNRDTKFVEHRQARRYQHQSLELD